MERTVGDDALRAQIRIRLAFWQAQGRRSIRTGPTWLWRGQYTRPYRESDLSVPTAAKMRRRAAHGHLLIAAGPRELRLRPWVSVRAISGWAVAGIVLACIGVIGSRTADHHTQFTSVAGWTAIGCLAIAATLTTVLAWARRDPLRLNAREVFEVTAAQRVLDWNPLAGDGVVSVGGAHVLEGIAICQQLQACPAWMLPGIEALSWRFDADEEIFQIACAAQTLDEAEAAPADIGQQHHELRDALLTRLMALHRCHDTLVELDTRSRAAGIVIDPADEIRKELHISAAENELAAHALARLNAELTAHAQGYAALELGR